MFVGVSDGIGGGVIHIVIVVMTHIESLSVIHLTRQSRESDESIDSIHFIPFSSHRRNDLLAVSVSSRTLRPCEFHETC